MVGPKREEGPTGSTVGTLSKAIAGPQSSGVFLSAETQRGEILRLLRIRPHTSYELRRAGCYQCPTRVLELRRTGWPIQTTRVTIVDGDGFRHPGVALYSLSEGAAE